MHGPLQARQSPAPYACRRIAGSPDPLNLHHRHPDRYPVFLESAAPGPVGRYDILLAFPADRLEMAGNGELRCNGEPRPGGFLQALEQELAAAAGPSPVDGPLASMPFHSGWFVFLAYELAREIEPGLSARLPQSEMPMGLALRIPAALIRDRLEDRTWFVGDRTAVQQFASQVEADIRAVSSGDDCQAAGVRAVAEDEERVFLAGVDTVKEWIRNGDVFQVNLSRAWRARMEPGIDPVSLYRRLRRANPAPFACLARLDVDTCVISSSPERLVSVRGGTVATRPIAGTHPRAANAAEDALLARELLAHPKERAEHIMLIDLERNDLGRICVSGSVKVNELMGLESYSHVHHIVSEVSGNLRSDVGPVDVIRAVFPGGTITGCPKIRCMEIIADLECAPRGAYTGSLGYINRDGSMDLNILIRTLVRRGNRLQLRAGAGLVADSDPLRELAETRAKAAGVLRALV